MEFRKPYTAHRVAFVNTEPSKTKQEFREEADVNRILSKFRRTRLLDYVTKHEPFYADLPDALDFETAQNVIASGRNAFEEMPAGLRKRFNNSPARFLSFMETATGEQLVALGLATRKAKVGTESENPAISVEESAPPDAAE